MTRSSKNISASDLTGEIASAGAFTRQHWMTDKLIEILGNNILPKLVEPWFPVFWIFHTGTKWKMVLMCFSFLPFLHNYVVLICNKVGPYIKRCVRCKQNVALFFFFFSMVPNHCKHRKSSRESIGLKIMLPSFNKSINLTLPFRASLDAEIFITVSVACIS